MWNMVTEFSVLFLEEEIRSAVEGQSRESGPWTGVGVEINQMAYPHSNVLKTHWSDVIWAQALRKWNKQSVNKRWGRDRTKVAGTHYTWLSHQNGCLDGMSPMMLKRRALAALPVTLSHFSWWILRSGSKTLVSEWLLWMKLFFFSLLEYRYQRIWASPWNLWSYEACCPFSLKTEMGLQKGGLG